MGYRFVGADVVIALILWVTLSIATPEMVGSLVALELNVFAAELLSLGPLGDFGAETVGRLLATLVLSFGLVYAYGALSERAKEADSTD